MAIATCVECDEEIEISERARLGQKVMCSSCGASLEVVNTGPLELDWAYEDDDDEEEWELDDEYDTELDEYDDFDDDLDDDFDDIEDDDDTWQ